ncbi:uncharacterized protein BO95DRAFT_462784 [Aspergillus brunneoviolaceus CBS 621.78]|uniref:Uncharacterized protein n=1 Tax=Aspergillus brunneoviolaceus CBS 621.78 TaxID=1450534 RepID=A0ACD1GBS5_9EURO|nr:hypothetical protein BO95DRAFT_462784 [Aspergillus brunneoviolaceus CBS 621.78]RAH46703.1 hypothetical protein BO95DRAFT_462784 [Aspergillus brunneoviolaceus CBS 621.78]
MTSASPQELSLPRDWPRAAGSSPCDLRCLVGPDGVHSRTRSLVQTLLRRATGAAVDIDPMAAHFHGIFGRAFNEDLGIEQAVLRQPRPSHPPTSVDSCAAFSVGLTSGGEPGFHAASA